MIGLCETCTTQKICILNHNVNKGNDDVSFTASRCAYYRRPESNNIIDTQQDKISFAEIMEHTNAVNALSKKNDRIDIHDDDIVYIEGGRICPACNEESHRFVKCDKCGKTVCEGCIVDTPTDGHLCPDCF